MSDEQAHTNKPRDWIAPAATFTTMISMLIGTQLLYLNYQLDKMKLQIDSVRIDVRSRGSEVLSQIGAISNTLRSRGYVVDSFGGNASVKCEKTPNGESLKITAAGDTGSYGGINIFGNDVLFPPFNPINLSKVSALEIRFKNITSQDTGFFLRLKDINNYETHKIYMDRDVSVGKRNESRSLVFRLSTQDPEVQRLKGALLMSISIATDFANGREVKKIELESIIVDLDVTGDDGK